MITENELLHYISRQPRHIAGYKQILHDFAVRGKERRAVEEMLRQLTRQKKLVPIGKERWSLPTSASSQDLVIGQLSMHRDGYGFVTPDPDALPPRARGKLQGDIFIPPPEIGNAMHRDQVLVELGRIRPDGKAEGRILRVVQREQQTIVGLFHYGDRYNYVRPMDEKVGMDIIIPPGMEHPTEENGEEFQASPQDRDLKNASLSDKPGQSVKDVAQAPSPVSERLSGRDHSRASHQNARHAYGNIGMDKSQPGAAVPRLQGKSASQGDSSSSSASHSQKPLHPRQKTPHRVLGGEAARRTWDDLENVVVEVEITQWPSPTQNPRGRVVEILGYEDDFGVDVEIIIRKHHIRHVFPPAVLAEAQEISPSIGSAEIARRLDYRDLPIVTIDGETARDFDDAVLVERLADGHYRLHVHIADVAQYVEDGSAIDEEARKRGTSVYFPDRAVPMLPLELSTDICSLRPQVERLVLSCVMEIDRQGEVLGYELAEGIIRSAQRMTYTAVNAIIEGDADVRGQYEDLVSNFELMYELAQILNRKRVKRGSIDFDLPEPVIEFDDFGLMKSISPSERNWAHRLIEEFMLSANETVATHLEQHSIASLYRIHEKPDPKRIYDFETIAASFGYSLGVGALPVKRVTTRADKRSHYGSGRRAPTVELPEEVHVTPRMYQKLVQKITGKPEERVLSYLMLRSLKQARYSEINEGHFALAAPSYTHFTSPIRRYPDLIVHRILKDVLRDHGGPMRGNLKSSEEQASPWSKRREFSSLRRHGGTQTPFSPRRRGGAEEQEASCSNMRGEHRSFENRVAQAPSPVLKNVSGKKAGGKERAQDCMARALSPLPLAAAQGSKQRQSDSSCIGLVALAQPKTAVLPSSEENHFTHRDRMRGHFKSSEDQASPWSKRRAYFSPRRRGGAEEELENASPQIDLEAPALYTRAAQPRSAADIDTRKNQRDLELAGASENCVAQALLPVPSSAAQNPKQKQNSRPSKEIVAQPPSAVAFEAGNKHKEDEAFGALKTSVAQAPSPVRATGKGMGEEPAPLYFRGKPNQRCVGSDEAKSAQPRAAVLPNSYEDHFPRRGKEICQPEKAPSTQSNRSTSQRSQSPEPSSVSPCLRGEADVFLENKSSARYSGYALPAYRNRPDRERSQSAKSSSASPRSGSPGSPSLASRGEGLRGEKGVSHKLKTVAGLSLETLHDIAETSSQTERAADEAERELLEWKKVKFMQDRIGEEFSGLIVSTTKFGIFVELHDLFIEGLVPIDSLEDDHYTFRENTRQIIGQHSNKTFSIGDRVRVLVDRIDPVQHKIQFALVEEKPARAQKRHKKSRR